MFETEKKKKTQNALLFRVTDTQNVWQVMLEGEELDFFSNQPKTKQKVTNLNATPFETPENDKNDLYYKITIKKKKSICVEKVFFFFLFFYQSGMMVRRKRIPTVH